MNAKILEIFQSIQGEGKYAGVSQVFVRFFECHMHCVWCDTPDSIGDTTRKYEEYNLDRVIQKIDELWDDSCHSVSLTGGEPLLQKDFLKSLIPRLHAKKRPIYLETSGVLYKQLEDIIDGIDTIAMDIKLPSSTQCRPFWEEHGKFLKTALKKDAFIKTVVSSVTKKEDILKAIDLVSGIDPHVLFILQPNSFDMHNGVIKKCLEFEKICAKRLKNVRILPQIHKFMKLP